MFGAFNKSAFIANAKASQQATFERLKADLPNRQAAFDARFNGIVEQKLAERRAARASPVSVVVTSKPGDPFLAGDVVVALNMPVQVPKGGIEVHMNLAWQTAEPQLVSREWTRGGEHWMNDQVLRHDQKQGILWTQVGFVSCPNRLNPGTHSFPFKFGIPMFNWPPFTLVIDGNGEAKCQITYIVHAVLDGQNISARVPFFPPYKENGPPAVLDAQNLAIGGEDFKDGTSFNVFFDKSVYQLGEDVSGTLTFSTPNANASEASELIVTVTRTTKVHFASVSDVKKESTVVIKTPFDVENQNNFSFKLAGFEHVPSFSVKDCPITLATEYKVYCTIQTATVRYTIDVPIQLFKP